jgi:release factor glutamine methyltransferase
VDDGVFIPRPRSELLAHRANAAAKSSRSRPVVVVDLCCGAGALGAAIAAGAPHVELHGADIDPAAVRCARSATAPFGGRVYVGDLFDPLPAGLCGRVDVLVANGPYVPTGELEFLPVDARRYERPAALDGGDDGLLVLGRIIGGAPRWLRTGGAVLVECAEHQAASLADHVTAAGLHAEVVREEDIGATVVIGTRGRPAGDGPSGVE